jgi:hypothetical protein
VIRVDFPFFRKLILEGLSIPIHLEELHPLRECHTRIIDWKERVEKALGCYEVEGQGSDESVDESDSSSDEIINTKTSQF